MYIDYGYYVCFVLISTESAVPVINRLFGFYKFMKFLKSNIIQIQDYIVNFLIEIITNYISKNNTTHFNFNKGRL